MKNLLTILAALLAFSIVNNQAEAQQHYDNTYSASNAAMLQVQGTTRTEYMLKGATIVLPNGSNTLNLQVNIPYSDINNTPTDGSTFAGPSSHFNLAINIDPNHIRENLTSGKTFVTHGLLALNNISKQVTVSYTPIASGVMQDGNFNVYITVQFAPADFNLAVPDTNTQVVIQIKDAKVNRV